jgi:hypothetical protein
VCVVHINCPIYLMLRAMLLVLWKSVHCHYAKAATGSQTDHVPKTLSHSEYGLQIKFTHKTLLPPPPSHVFSMQEFKDGAPLEENDNGAIRRGTDKMGAFACLCGCVRCWPCENPVRSATMRGVTTHYLLLLLMFSKKRAPKAKPPITNHYPPPPLHPTGADDKPVSILACGHAYCNSCLLQSLERERTPRCPICRRTLDESPGPDGGGPQPPGGGGGGGGGDGESLLLLLCVFAR